MKQLVMNTRTDLEMMRFLSAILFAAIFAIPGCAAGVMCLISITKSEFTRHLRLSSLKWGLLWKSYFRTAFNGFIRAAYSSSNTDGVGMQTTL